MQNRTELLKPIQELMQVGSLSLVEEICLKFTDEELSTYIPILEAWNMNPRYLFESYANTTHLFQDLPPTPQHTEPEAFQNPYSIIVYTHLTKEVGAKLPLTAEEFKEQTKSAQQMVKAKNKIKGIQNATLIYKLKTQSFPNAKKHKAILLLTGAEKNDMKKATQIDAQLVHTELSSEVQELYTKTQLGQSKSEVGLIDLAHMKRGISHLEKGEYEKFIETQTSKFAYHAAKLNLGELVNLSNNYSIHMREQIRTFTSALHEIAQENVVIRAALAPYYSIIAEK